MWVYNNINLLPDLFTSLKDRKATLKEPEQPIAIAPTPTEWPVLPSSQESSVPASSIQLEQRTPNNNNSQTTPVSWTIKREMVGEDKRDRVGKYAPYFQGNTILLIPELVAAVEPKTLFLIVTDLRTRRLAGLKKESFGELLKTAGIPCRYFCQWS